MYKATSSLLVYVPFCVTVTPDEAEPDEPEVAEFDDAEDADPSEDVDEADEVPEEDEAPADDAEDTLDDAEDADPPEDESTLPAPECKHATKKMLTKAHSSAANASFIRCMFFECFMRPIVTQHKMHPRKHMRPATHTCYGANTHELHRNQLYAIQPFNRVTFCFSAAVYSTPLVEQPPKRQPLTKLLPKKAARYSAASSNSAACFLPL